jgi:hypothetical protein
MGSLNFVDTFVTFLALPGPQKILLSFDEASRRYHHASTASSLSPPASRRPSPACSLAGASSSATPSRSCSGCTWPTTLSRSLTAGAPGSTGRPGVPRLLPHYNGGAH